MSGSKKYVAVSRSYEPVPKHCAEALALLLKVPARKETAQPAAPNDGEGRSDEFPVSSILLQDS